MSEVKPLVAIHCLVYNHEPYLRDCFEGFVMQQTNFPFVAIVHDDASTDNSAAIIREYEEKYPDIIKPIYEAENQYSKRDGSVTRIMNAAIDATGAKYVAMCEGDDYWTDPLKLQKQVDFLNNNLDLSKFSEKDQCTIASRLIALLGSEEYQLSKMDKKRETQILHTSRKDINRFFPSCTRGNRTRYWLKVQDGCDNFCSYCTVPIARGKSRNGSIESTVKQAQEAALEGAKEIVISGVNIGDFGKTT